MKYVKKGLGTFTTEQLSILETLTEIADVVAIAKNTIKNIPDVSDSIKHELDVAIKKLHQAEDYIPVVRKKMDIILKYVPIDIQEKHYL